MRPETPARPAPIRAPAVITGAGRRCSAAWLRWLALLVLLLWCGSGGAQAPPAPAPSDGGEGAAEPAPQQPDPNIAEAKRLFFEGNALRKAGNCRRALEFFIRSRALVGSPPNIINAGVCLAEIGRYDEALEMYEEVVAKFSTELTATERAQLSQQMAKLQRKVGSIDVIANVKGSLVVDGRPRGNTPLLSPVRVLPGAHTVAVVKDGYRSFEQRVEVALGKTARVRAKLSPLVVAGGLRVDAGELEGAEVFVDGAMVGHTPWEGTLAPGEHVYYVRRGDQGSGPARAVVVKGQTVLARARVALLGRELRIVTRPAEAALWVDEVAVGRGQWRGRLPLGVHQIEARASGYFDLRRRIETTPDGPDSLDLALDADPEHPQWGAIESGWFVLDAFGSFAVTPSFASGAEATCHTASCSDSSAALGFAAGARAAYEFPFGVSVHLVGGYLRASKTVARSIDTTFDASGTPTRIRYDVNDALTLSAPFAGAGAGYRFAIAGPLELRANAAVGVAFTRTRDEATATASGDERTIGTVIDGSGGAVSDVDVLILPDVQLGLRFDGFGVGLGLMAAVLVLSGPDQALGAVRVRGEPCLPGQPTAVDCAPGSSVVASEQAYGPMVWWMPTATVGYAF